MVISVGYRVEGMSGPGWGARTRLSHAVGSPTRAGVSVHVLGEEGVHEEANPWNASTLTLIPKFTQVQRLVVRPSRISAFAKSTESQFIHLGALLFWLRESANSWRNSRSPGVEEKRGGSYAAPFYCSHILPFTARSIEGWLALSYYGVNEIEQGLRKPRNRIFPPAPIVDNRTVAIQKTPSTSPRYALALGHLEQRKNLETVIRASSGPRWPNQLELWIAGDDRCIENELRKIALCLNAPVRFLGPVTEHKKWELLKQATIAVTPSLLEGFGLVAIEATLACTIALVSDRAALPEIAGHPMAEVNARDPVQWAQRVGMLLENQNLRSEVLDSQIRRATRFETGKVIETLFEIYRKLDSSWSLTPKPPVSPNGTLP